VMVGTPAALTRELKATGEGRIVQSNSAAQPNITVTAFFGSFLSETSEIHPENGRTPSRATAQINRELATPATVVFCISMNQQPKERSSIDALPRLDQVCK
jgi:hypothetical protein